MSIQLTIEILINGIHENSCELQVQKQTKIYEIFDLLIASQQSLFQKIIIVENKNDWTCISKSLNKQYTNLEQTLECGNDEEYLTINIPQQQSNENQLKSLNDLNYCQTHLDCPIQFICTEIHICQRRICAKCFHDEIHQGISSKYLVPFDTFSESLQRQAEQILEHKKDWLIYNKKIKDLEKQIEVLIYDQNKNLSNAYQYYNKQFNQVSYFLECLKKKKILDFSNSDIYEMVQALQLNHFKKQTIINQINSCTLEQNLDLYESHVQQFSEKVKELKINYVTIQQWQKYLNIISTDQLESDNMALLYQNLNLINPLKTDLHYGKYMASASNLQLDVYTNQTFIKSLDYFVNDFTTINSISQYMAENSKNQQLYLRPLNEKCIWNFHSEVRDKDITELDKTIYHFMKIDKLKINIETISVQIEIIEGQNQLTLKQTFSENCTLQDIEEAVLQYFEVKNNSDYQVEFYYQNINFKIKSSKTTTLKELLVNENIKIYVKFKYNESELTSQNRNIQQNESKINVECKLINACTMNKDQKLFKLQCYENDTLEQLRKKLILYLGIGSDLIDLYIDNQKFSYLPQRMKTLKQFGVKSDSDIRGEYYTY